MNNAHTHITAALIALAIVYALVMLTAVGALVCASRQKGRRS